MLDLQFRALNLLNPSEKLYLAILKARNMNECFSKAVFYQNIGLIKWYREKQRYSANTPLKSFSGLSALNVACKYRKVDSALFLAASLEKDQLKQDSELLYILVGNICSSLIDNNEDFLEKDLYLFKVLLFKGANMALPNKLGKIPLLAIEEKLHLNPNKELIRKNAIELIYQAIKEVRNGKFNVDLEFTVPSISPTQLFCKEIGNPNVKLYLQGKYAELITKLTSELGASYVEKLEPSDFLWMEWPKEPEASTQRALDTFWLPPAHVEQLVSSFLPFRMKEATSPLTPVFSYKITGTTNPTKQPCLDLDAAQKANIVNALSNTFDSVSKLSPKEAIYCLKSITIKALESEIQIESDDVNFEERRQMTIDYMHLLIAEEIKKYEQKLGSTKKCN